MNLYKNQIIVTLFFVFISQTAFSQVLSLFCQGRYQTGELLQLRLEMDLSKNVLITGDTTTPLIIDDFNIMWRSEANGVQFESMLNRWTGELTATMIEIQDVKPNFLNGICETPDNIKF